MSIKIKRIHGVQKPWFKKRALAIAITSALSATPALAQDDEDTAKDEDGDVEEMVVQGMRQNLMSAQQLKYNADTVVDSITAEDLGSFPDKSIAEALQRVAGVTVNRFAATSDTAHFSAEPSGVLVRGLPHVRTEFNGRDSFSANSSRGLSWGDVSPELMAGVDTYKNQMAELIEGGIAGTVNMRTRLPFDQEDTGLHITVAENYGDLSDDMTPEASALYTTRWDTALGEMGIMSNLAYSEVHTRTQGSQLYRMNRFRNVYQQGAGNDDLVYIPGGVNFRDNLYDRERLGGSLAFQWADPEDKLRFSAQYNRTNYEQSWEEYVIQTSPADLSFGQSVFFEVTGQDPNAPTDGTTIPVPAPGTDPFTFDQRGLFQTGVITSGTGWWGGDNTQAATFASNEFGDNMVNACYSWGTAGCDGGVGPTLRSIDASTGTRSSINENMTQDLSLNLKWELSDTTRANFDLQFVDATVSNYDIEMSFNTFATPSIDLTGEHPRVDLLAGETFNYNPSAFRYSNPNNYYIRSIMDHVEDSEGQQMAFRSDFEFDIGTGWMESLKVGVRAADREQTVRWSGYNWQNVANTWTGDQAPYFNIDQHGAANGLGVEPGFNGYPNNLYVRRGFAGDFFGESGLLNPTTFIFANINLLKDQNQMAAAMGAQGLGFAPGAPGVGAGGWDPICSNFGDRAGELPGTCFTPAEISDVNEETQALYAQLNFGGADAEIFGIPVSGNIGVRYVKTSEESAGGIAYAGLQASELDEGPSGDGIPPDPPVPFNVGFYLSDDDKAFMNDADVLDVQTTDHENWLPSFNAKLEFTDELLLRFAASKAMSRPDIGYLRNYVGVSKQLPDVNDINDPLWIKDGLGNVTGAKVNYTAGAQNPFLAPTTAVQYDLSLEWYFSDVGSLTFATFSKDFTDYIQFGKYFRDLTNNGVTRTVEVSGPLNGSGASITGYELAYQTFFDFLPEPWTGFGVQMNYTVLNNDGIQTPNLTNVGGEGTIISDQAPDQIGVNSLEGLSDDAYTFILMYENENTESRLAYTWRSEYMVTAVDCCVAYPIWTEDYGQVDGSFTWHLGDNFDFKLEGKNLTNEETVNKQQVSSADDGGLLMPTGWFQNDRTYTIGIGYRY